jgi:hypothetical protein
MIGQRGRALTSPPALCSRSPVSPTKIQLPSRKGLFDQLAEGAGPLPLVVPENPRHASLVLSYNIDRGTPPKNANADTCPSRKASVVSAG